MPETPFIITIDTEGDDLWSAPRHITTGNAAYLPRFQTLCERYGFKPVYLVNYEMANSPFFVEFGRALAKRGAAEIGMHLHAWNSPPLVPLTRDDFRFRPYLVEYPDEVMREKIRVITRTLEDRFEQAMVSHRAGRWAFDSRYAAMLVNEGYRVDCSVTPGVDWRANPGSPRGNGGSDYRAFPDHAYFFDPSDIARPAPGGPLLEVPMSVRRSALAHVAPWLYRARLVRTAAARISPALRWLCPVPLMQRDGLEPMATIARDLRAEGATHLELMLHSSELMPGGGPVSKNKRDIGRLYAGLERLFEEVSGWCRSMTLGEFHSWFANSPARTGASGRAPVAATPAHRSGLVRT